MMQSTLRAVTKEEKRKSTTSQLLPEAKDLFTLLLATNWGDRYLKLNDFSERLLADKDPTKALNLVHLLTRN
jgi:hypothetical protein